MQDDSFKAYMTFDLLQCYYAPCGVRRFISRAEVFRYLDKCVSKTEELLKEKSSGKHGPKTEGKEKSSGKQSKNVC